VIGSGSIFSNATALTGSLCCFTASGTAAKAKQPWQRLYSGGGSSGAGHSLSGSNSHRLKVAARPMTTWVSMLAGSTWRMNSRHRPHGGGTYSVRSASRQTATISVIWCHPAHQARRRARLDCPGRRHARRAQLHRRPCDRGADRQPGPQPVPHARRAQITIRRRDHVAPATYNTICKWARGISDTYALGVLAETTGLAVPTVVLPFVNTALAARAPFRRSVDELRSEGVVILRGPGGIQPHEPPHRRRPHRQLPTPGTWPSAKPSDSPTLGAR
jgi:hypothetical protein